MVPPRIVGVQGKSWSFRIMNEFAKYKKFKAMRLAFKLHP